MANGLELLFVDGHFIMRSRFEFLYAWNKETSICVRNKGKKVRYT